MVEMVQQPTRFAVGHELTAMPPAAVQLDVGNPFWKQVPLEADSSHAPPVLVPPLDPPDDVPLLDPPDDVPLLDPPDDVPPPELLEVEHAEHLLEMHAPAVWSAEAHELDVSELSHF
jgi:hypothetical protein